MSRVRTYSHLAARKRIPSEYEIVSTDLLWYPPRGGFSTAVGVGPWVAEHQQRTPLKATFAAFADPRQTTYFRYVGIQRAKEVFVDGLLHASDLGRPAAPTPAATARFERAFVPMRHAWHGLQMVSAYVGHLAPEGRVTICAAFQAGDLTRRVQRISERTAMLWPGHGADVAGRARAAWEQEPAWQPLRKVVERLLVTWDLGEALVASCVVVGPVVDALFLVEAAARARADGDPCWAEILGSFDQDGAWHRAWSRAALDVAFAEHDGNRAIVQGWVDAWRPAAEEVVRALAPWLELDEAAASRALAAIGGGDA